MKKSETIMLAVMGLYLGGTWWYERDQQSLIRNRYLSYDDCSCAYSSAQCRTNDGGDWVGPWYLEDASLRSQDRNDPGPGRCGTGSGHGGSSGGGYGGRASTAIERGSPVGTEPGHRRGFGGTARFGRAGG